MLTEIIQKKKILHDITYIGDLSKTPLALLLFPFQDTAPESPRLNPAPPSRRLGCHLPYDVYPEHPT